MAALHSFVAEAFTLLALGIFFIGLRTYARAKHQGIRNLKIDDYLMILVAIPYTTEILLAYTVGARFYGLANNSMTEEQRAALPPESNEYNWRVNGSKIQIAGWAVYTSVLWLIKSAICAFYIRLTSGLAEYRVRIKIGFILIAATYFAIMASIFFGCRPFHKLWQIQPDPGNFCQPASSKLLIFLVVTLNIITDIYLMIIPIPVLWKAKVPRLKKVMLVLLFSGGIFVMVAGILRCILILKNPTTGPQQAASWAVRESFVAVVTSSIPMVWVWVRQKLGRYRSSLPTDTKENHNSAPVGEHYNSQRPTTLGEEHSRDLARSGLWTYVYAEQQYPARPLAQQGAAITKQVDIRILNSEAVDFKSTNVGLSPKLDDPGLDGN
ncbi:hypothetical protein EDB81DRAFT_848883 [Dactylonectria macrodidyma]|uniref:Rhodopsin domain-containing protein n=1 Tax=Dactylonectria macrodidyma TaxID=307937 RepID=A0A9P9D4D2_9HYPO|nr:hypothetical protein EDB81DRAFT_848883 [Dactylonectria macrodidyma]